MAFNRKVCAKPVGLWQSRTAVSTLFTFWPPGPPDLMVENTISYIWISYTIYTANMNWIQIVSNTVVLHHIIHIFYNTKYRTLSETLISRSFCSGNTGHTSTEAKLVWRFSFPFEEKGDTLTILWAPCSYWRAWYDSRLLTRNSIDLSPYSHADSSVITTLKNFFLQYLYKK